MQDSQQIFKYWAKELLYAFKDLTYRSTYSLNGNITLRNVYIGDLGIKLFIKKLKFGPLRDESIQFHLQVEANMLNCFAKILIEMLSNETEDKLMGTIDDLLNSLEIEAELKAIIYECMHAKDKILEKEKENYDNEINKFILQEKMKKQ